MTDRIPQVGDEFIPEVFSADEEPHYWDVPVLEGEYDLIDKLTIVEVGHAYTKDGAEGGEPDGGFEIVASDGITYDAYWHELGQCWVYGLET
jgi:hypothetical protein